MAGQPHVAVVGAGIIGSSIAINLARKGCKVTVIEAGSAPAEGATAKSWAWLNANRKTPPHYKAFNKAGMDEWKKLSDQLAVQDTFAEFPGTIYIGDDRENDSQYSSERLEATDIHKREPEIAHHAAEKGGRLYPQEGYGYPANAAASFLEEAKRRGAKIHLNSEVTSFSSHDGSATAVCTASSSHDADIIVLAAGLGIPELARKLGSEVFLVDKPGTLTVLTQPLPRLLNHIVVTDDAFLMQRRDGEFMISFFKAAVNHTPGAEPEKPLQGEEAGEKDGEEIAEHLRESIQEAAEGHQHEAAEHVNASDAIAQREIDRAAAICPVLRDASLGSFSMAKYPYPADAHPILGWLPGFRNVYVAVTHSGATLGPLIGRLASAEILGEEQEMLRHYRPDRDFSDQSHLY